MRRIQREVVSALIFSQDEKLLQGKKDPRGGGVYADCWHMPGGGIEAGEDRLTALIREVKEETGIDIFPYPIELIDIASGEAEKTIKETEERVICEMTFYDYKITISDRVAADIQISLQDDLVEHRWSRIDELANLKLTPPSIDLFTKLGYLAPARRLNE